MLELKITGQNATELLNSALQVTALLLKGAGSPATPSIAKQPVGANSAVEQPTVEAKPDEPVAETVKPARKSAKKADVKPDPKQTDLEQAIAETKPKEMPADGDEVPNMTGKADPKPAPYFKDCKAAAVLIYDNCVARAKAAGEADENKIMASKIAYMKQLFYGFGIQKLMDLKPEQYAEFISKAQPYIDGTAKLEAV